MGVRRTVPSAPATVIRSPASVSTAWIGEFCVVVEVDIVVTVVVPQSSARTQSEAARSQTVPAAQKNPVTHISTAGRTKMQPVSMPVAVLSGNGEGGHSLHAVTSSPQTGGHEEPQALCTWPPQSLPMPHDDEVSVSVGSVGSTAEREAQHAGSGAEQAAPSGQQPVHSAEGPPVVGAW